MIGSNFHKRVFFHDGSGDVEGGCLGVEIDRGDADCEGCVDFFRRGGARGGFGRYAAKGGGAEDIALGEEIVRVPHVFRVFGEEGDCS